MSKDTKIQEFQKAVQKAVHFKLKEGSNYCVKLSHQEEYIIEYEQFLGFVEKLFTTESQFVTINNSIVNRNYIKNIDPTTKKTEAQKAEIRKFENGRLP